MAPRWQQEPEKGPAEPPLAETTLMVGVMSVLFSEVLADCATPVPSCHAVGTGTCATASGSHQGRAGPGTAELRADCNQERQQQDLEGPGCH